MYETFDHTADLGLRVRAADLGTLFAEAGLALTACLVENPDAVRREVTFDVKLPADDLEFLLFDWLKALLYRFDSEKTLFSRFEVKVSAETGLQAAAWGERMDESRHEPAHEVKAITYHGLKVEKDGDGWLAEVIVDI
jgi:SHS2 domain-containing protein